MLCRFVPLALIASTASAEPFGLELRMGGQAPRNFPELAAYASLEVARETSAVIGYEVIRSYGVSLPRSCRTTVSPAIVSGLRGGVARRLPLARGFGLRGAALVGVAAPLLTPGPFPEGVGGAVLETALDLEATWSWRALEVALFIDASYGAGTLSSGVCATGPPASAGASDLGLLYGLGLGVRL